MAMQLILLERVDNLGNLGDVVTVKPGYARNYLLPQNKALRMTKDNIAYFEAQKGEIEKQNEQRRKEAQTQAEKLEGLNINIIRHASESGQLYGSVTARDIAQAISEQSKQDIKRDLVEINQVYKMVGLFPVTVALHPEIKVDVSLNIARSEEEARKQAKTGKALVTDYDQKPLEEDARETPAEKTEQVVEKAETKADEAVEKAKTKMLEKGALEAEKEKSEEDALKTAEKEAKSKAKSEVRAAKKAEIEAAKEEAEKEAEEAETTDEEAEESDK